MRGFKSLLPRQKIPQNSYDSEGFFLFIRLFRLEMFICKIPLLANTPKFTPTSLLLPLFSQVFIVVLHTRRRVLHHLFRGMSIHVQRKTGRGVTQHILDALYIGPTCNRNCGRRVPLWHNKDKSDNPLRRNGLIGLSLFFFQ